MGNWGKVGTGIKGRRAIFVRRDLPERRYGLPHGRVGGPGWNEVF